MWISSLTATLPRKADPIFTRASQAGADTSFRIYRCGTKREGSIENRRCFALCRVYYNNQDGPCFYLRDIPSLEASRAHRAPARLLMLAFASTVASTPRGQEAGEILGALAPKTGPEKGKPLLPFPRSQIPVGSDGPLFVVATDDIPSQEDRVTLETLGGVLARRSPKLYTVPSPAGRQESHEHFWLAHIAHDLGVEMDRRYIHNASGFFEHFASSVAGYVRFDLAQAGSINAALIRCAAHPEGAIAIGKPQTAAFFERLGVRQLFDATFDRPFTAYHSSRPSLSDRLVVFQPDDGSRAPHLAGYAVFARAATLEFPIGDNAELLKQASSQVLDDIENSGALGAAFGWSSNEFEYVSTLSARGIWVHASDWSDDLPALSNLVVHAQLESARQQLLKEVQTQRFKRMEMEQRHRKRRLAAAAEGVHTVAFVMSDGDNLQWLQRDWSEEKWFGSEERGAVPIGWTIPASAVQLLPTVLSWLQRRATANDTFIAGPSGAGYVLPDRLPSALAAPFAEATSRLMSGAGLRMVNVIGDMPTATSVHELAAQPNIDAVLYWTFDAGYAGLGGNVAYVNGKPIIGGRRSLWGDETEGPALGVDALVKSLSALPKDPTDPNSYSVVPVHAWTHNYSSVVRVVRALQARGGFDIVSPEELVKRLIDRTARRQQCPMPSGRFDGTTLGPDCVGCSIAGNGSCMFTCNDCAGTTAAPSCDLRVCSEIRLEESSFICADTGMPCPGAPASELAAGRRRAATGTERASRRTTGPSRQSSKD